MTDKQKISNMHICCILLLLISMTNGFDHRFKQRSSILRQFQNLLDNEKEKVDLAHRHHQYENDELDSVRRLSHDDDDEEEQYMILRTATESNNTNTEITLQNRAAMNTRLRVLYTDANGNPAIVETGRLWTGQTKSVKLPFGATHIKILVEKDIFFETWRVAYESTLANGNQCIRIVGVTLFSKIHSCK